MAQPNNSCHRRNDLCRKEHFAIKNRFETEEALKTLLADTGGKKYYEEMNRWTLTQTLLWKTIQKTM